VIGFGLVNNVMLLTIEMNWHLIISNEWLLVKTIRLERPELTLVEICLAVVSQPKKPNPLGLGSSLLKILEVIKEGEKIEN
jgi:hypothetical protein